MDKIGEVKNIIYSKEGIAKNKDLTSGDLTNYDIKVICEKGILEKIYHGYYKLADDFISDEKVIVTIFPEAIIYLESALYLYGYIDFIPRQYRLGVKRTFSRSKSKIEYLNIKFSYLEDKYYYLGQTTFKVNDVNIKIFDREKTICDCFKNKNKMDSETFNKAVKAYALDPNKNINNLIKYSYTMNISKKVFEIMGVLFHE